MFFLLHKITTAYLINHTNPFHSFFFFIELHDLLMSKRLNSLLVRTALAVLVIAYLVQLAESKTVTTDLQTDATTSLKSSSTKVC